MNIRFIGIAAALAMGSGACMADTYFGAWVVKGLETDISPNTSGGSGNFFENAQGGRDASVPTTANYPFGPSSGSASWADLSFSLTSATGNGATDAGIPSGPRHASADMTVNGVSYILGGLVFTADSITSHADVSGSRGSWTTNSSGAVVNGNLTIDGVQVVLPQNPGLDDEIYNQNGVQVWLNREVHDSANTHGDSIINAVEFDFSGFKATDTATVNFGYAALRTQMRE